MAVPAAEGASFDDIYMALLGGYKVLLNFHKALLDLLRALL